MEEFYHIENEMIHKIERDHLEPDKLLSHLGWYRLLTQRDIVTQRDKLLDACRRISNIEDKRYNDSFGFDVEVDNIAKVAIADEKE